MEDFERLTFDNYQRRRDAEARACWKNELDRQERENRKAARAAWCKTCVSNACYVAGGFFAAITILSQTMESAGLAAFAGIMFIYSARIIVN